MKTRTYVRASTVLSGAGTLFSGYLSSIRLTSGVCAFAEPCPFFLGHPACYTGFALFATMLAVSLAGLLRGRDSVWPMVANGILSLVGVIFAASLTLGDLFAVAGGVRYSLGLPSCAYGLVFFAAMIGLSIAALVTRAHPPSLRPREA
jgi:uncharacterized membrane protein